MRPLLPRVRLMGASRLDLAAPSRWAQADLTTPPPQGFFSACEPAGASVGCEALGGPACKPAAPSFGCETLGARLQARGSCLLYTSDAADE